MKQIALILLLVLSSFTYANQDIAPEVSLALELFEVMKVDKTNRQLIDQMVEAQITNNPSLAPFKHVLKNFLNTNISYESTKYELATIYLDVFTTDEIKELITFYSSPVGQKSIDTMPVIFQKTEQLAAEIIQINQQDLQIEIVKEAERIQKLQEKNAEPVE